MVGGTLAKRMRKFIKMLFSRWMTIALFLSGLLSLVADLLRANRPAWITIAIFVVAFFYAAYDVFKKQEERIGVLEDKVKEKDQREQAELIIYPKPSRYIPHVATQYPNKAREAGTFLELNLSVENKGNRNSHINKFSLWLDGIFYESLKPMYKVSIQSRRSNYGIGKDWFLPIGQSMVTIQARRVVEGRLLFFVDSVIGPERREAEATLEMRDTDGHCVSADFGLQDANQ